MAAGFERTLPWLAYQRAGCDTGTHLVVDALVEEHAERPPVDLTRVSLALVHFRSQVCEGSRFAGEWFVWGEVRSNILLPVSKANQIR